MAPTGPSGSLRVEVAPGTVVAGQPVEVTVRFAADRPVEVDGGDVELVRAGAVAHYERGWMGAGATISFRRSAVLDRAELDIAGPLAAGEHLVRAVRLLVPPGEATVAGYLVQQHYGVRATLRSHGGRDHVGSAAVRVEAAAAGRDRSAGAPVVGHDAGFAALGIENLSGRRLAAGVPLSGLVTVAPRAAGGVRGARVELVLDERVPARRDEVPLEEDRTRTTVVSSAPVAGHLDLQPGRVLRLPFTLPVPAVLPAPSISAPEFTLRWLLRAVVDRPRHRDPCATVELVTDGVDAGTHPG
jgi:hypothetical protein